MKKNKILINDYRLLDSLKKIFVKYKLDIQIDVFDEIPECINQYKLIFGFELIIVKNVKITIEKFSILSFTDNSYKMYNLLEYIDSSLVNKDIVCFFIFIIYNDLLNFKHNLSYNFLKQFFKIKLSYNRIIHILSVYKRAVLLNNLHGLNVNILELEYSCLLHDITKEFNIEQHSSLIEDSKIMNQSFNILHGFSAIKYIYNNFNIDNINVINAIKYHTIGKKNMNDLEKVLFISDFTEDFRIYDDNERIKLIANVNLDEALLEIFKIKLDKYNDLYTKELYDYYKEKS